MRNKIIPALYISFIILFTLKGIFILDPDLGWQIRIGQYIRTHGIPATDPLSFSMANYPYKDHSWLTSVFISYLYSHIGLIGLSFVFAVLAAASAYLQLGKNKASGLFPSFILLSVMLSFTGIRAQVMSWLGFSLLFLILNAMEKDKKWGLALPVLGAAWTNIHGGYSLAIIIIGAAAVFKSLQEKKINVYYFVLFLLSLVSTGLNPYGWGIWSVVFTTVGSPLTYLTINEWKPSIFFLQLQFWVFFGLCSSLLILNWRRIFLWKRALYIILAGMALGSMRNIPYFLIALLPFWKEEFPRVEKTILGKRGAEERYRKAQKIFLVFIAVVSLVQAGVDAVSIGYSTEEQSYPKQAVVYMKKHHITGRVFALYGWGGYLLWKLPGAAPYIDGRMPEWRWGQKDPRYTGNAFKEYYEILGGDIPVSVLTQKYGIRFALLPNAQIGPKKGKNPFAGKKILYQDKTALLYLLN